MLPEIISGLTMGKFSQSHYISAMATSFYGSQSCQVVQGKSGPQNQPGITQGTEIHLESEKNLSYDSISYVFPITTAI